MCPQVSFTTLNWSRSRNMMALRAVVRFGEAQQIARLCSNWLRFRRPVKDRGSPARELPREGARTPTSHDDESDAQHADNNSPARHERERLCSSARASTRSSGMLISSAPSAGGASTSSRSRCRPPPASLRFRTLLEPVVALDAGGARGGIGAHITQRV